MFTELTPSIYITYYIRRQVSEPNKVIQYFTDKRFDDYQLEEDNEDDEDSMFGSFNPNLNTGVVTSNSSDKVQIK